MDNSLSQHSAAENASSLLLVGQPHRALVTGATGYIGSHLVRRLVGDGWVVSGLTRGPHRPANAATGDIELFSTDGTFESVRAAVIASRPTVVFHLAALVLAVPQSEDVDQLVRSNVMLVTQLMEAMREIGTSRLVNTGSYWQFAADGSVHPRTLYAATKVAADAMVDFNCNRGLLAATLILYDVYGPHDSRSKLLNRLIRLDHSCEPLELTSGEQVVDYVYIDDVVNAYTRAASKLLTETGHGHQRYVVRGLRPLTLRNVVGILESVIGSQLPLSWGARVHADHDIMQPWLGGRSIPGWEPKVALEDGLRRMVRAVST